MKILIISRYPPFPGGRENFVLELVEELSKQHEILVLTPDQNDNTQSDNLIIKKYPNNKEVLKKIIIDFNPNVINSHTFYLSKDAFDIAKKLNILFGITLHGDQFAIGDKQRQELVSKICLDSEFVINVSENGKKSILKNIKSIKPEKLFVIKNGVNLEKFKKGTDIKRNKYRKELKIGNNKKVILIPTRIAPYKGLEFLIKMIVKNKRYLIKKDILFVISIPEYIFSEDEASLFDLLKNNIKKNNIDGLVKFIFLTYPEVKKAYLSTDFFLLPSQKEQLPISILEAMAQKIPIIATKVGGIPEVLSEQEALLIDFDNDIQLFESIKKIIKRDNTKFINSAFLKVSKSYSIKKVAVKYENIYLNLINNEN